MSGFDERERGFENRYAYDEELRFKAESRRNRAVAEWAGAKLGLAGEALEAYVKDVRKADLTEKGDDDVFRKIKNDLSVNGLAVTDIEIRTFMTEALAKAVADLAKA
jgi:hypothetical protein